MKKILFAFSSFLNVATASSEPNKIEYELSEKCSKSSELMFNQKHQSNIENTKEGQMVSGFENHYNSDLNKCFYMESNTIINGKKGTIYTELYDLNDNKIIATLLYDPATCKGAYSSSDCPIFMCIVGNEKCSTTKEFQKAIKKFMGE